MSTWFELICWRVVSCVHKAFFLVRAVWISSLQWSFPVATIFVPTFGASQKARHHRILSGSLLADGEYLLFAAAAVYWLPQRLSAGMPHWCDEFLGGALGSWPSPTPPCCPQRVYNALWVPLGCLPPFHWSLLPSTWLIWRIWISGPTAHFRRWTRRIAFEVSTASILGRQRAWWWVRVASGRCLAPAVLCPCPSCHRSRHPPNIQRVG